MITPLTRRADDDATSPPGETPAFLGGGGEMGARMRAHDWAATPLGSPETWPQSLRTSVSICLDCAFPILVWWGPELVKLYNDAYAPIIGSKHPMALGAPGREVWQEVWDVIGPMLGKVMTEGAPTRAQDLQLMLRRRGYAEECYFSFSYSPIRDENGVGGVFCPVMETTERVLGERRLRFLSRLAEQTANLHNEDKVFSVAAVCLAEHAAHDLPFVMFYKATGKQEGIRLAASAGIAPSAACPDTIATDVDGNVGWPFGSSSGSAVVIKPLGEHMADLPMGPWGKTPEHIVVVPLSRSPAALLGYMVAGLNPHRPVHEIRSFAELVAQQVGAAVANARAYEQERARAEALAEVDRAKTAFFSNVSHEFRTPLTLMLGPLEDVLSDPATPRAQAEIIELAHRNALRLLRLVNGLLDFSRIEAGRVDATYEPVDLAAYTAELASTFRSACERAGLTLDVDCPPLSQPVYVDRSFWEKIVLNLLSNAFKYTLAGSISVKLRQAEGMAELAVIDTGAGIPSTELPKLFERFHRIEGAKGRSIEGSGIGLALVHDLVSLQGGEVAVDSDEGKGSTFRVRVPLGTAHLPPDRIAASPLGPRAAMRADAFVEEALRWLPSVSGARAQDEVIHDIERYALAPIASAMQPLTGRVLVADDNADLRDYVRRLLEGRGYTVETVADGEVALVAARERRPDLLLTDVMMPKLSGFGLLAAVREDPDLADLPVIMLSARAGEEAKAEGFEAGADDYLAKPFSARELLARVTANLDVARTRREAAARVRASAERQRVSEERLRIALEGAEIGVWDLDLASNEGVWTEKHFEFLGLPIPKDSKGSFELWRERLHPGDAERTIRAFADAMGSGHRYRAEYRIIRADTGEVRWLAGFGHAVAGDAGGAGRTLGVVMDVTERKEAEAVLARDKAELARLVADRTRDLEATHAKMAHLQRTEALGQLAGGIAHDFNNVLQSVQGGARLIGTRAADPDKVRRLAQMIEDAAVRGSGITRRLLTFARRSDLRAEPINAIDLLSEIREILSHTLGAGIEIRVQVAPRLSPLLADRGQLETVLINLAANARDAMSGAGTLRLFAAAETHAQSRDDLPPALRPGSYVRLSVSDTGTGMSPEVVARACEPFYTTKPLGKGTGLGLAMARGFAEQSGGALGIESAPGRGTTVRLWFPKASSSGADVVDDDVGERILKRRNKACVMLVDDEALVREILAEQLEEAGYTVIPIGSAKEAIHLLDEGEAVDMLISDLSMPGVEGVSLIREARSRRPGLPAILLTGFANEAAEIASGDAATGGFSLLRKPIDGPALAETIAVLLSGAQETKGP